MRRNAASFSPPLPITDQWYLSYALVVLSLASRRNPRPVARERKARKSKGSYSVKKSVLPQLKQHAKKEAAFRILTFEVIAAGCWNNFTWPLPLLNSNSAEFRNDTGQYHKQTKKVR